jgi:DNA-binding CsgD family transcriptional regulator
MSDTKSTLTALTDLAYDAALAPSLWPDFLARLAQALGGASLGMSLRHPREGDPGWLLFHDSDPAYGRSYAEHYFRLDPFRVRSDALAPGACELMAGGSIEVAEVERSEFYNDRMRRQGFAPAPFIGLTLDRNPVGDPIGIGVFRPRIARAYGDRELRLLRVLSPHLQRATRTTLRLADGDAQLAATSGVLDLLPVAALLVEADGTVVRANRRAQQLVEHGAPFASGRVRLALEPDVVVELRRLLEDLRRTRPQGGRPAVPPRDTMIVRRGDDRSPLWLRPIPCSSPEVAGLDGPPGRFWVLIDDPDDLPRPSPGAIASLLGLTNAESRLTALLVAGHRLEEAAEALGIKHETARSHLKAAFRKKGARSQTDLVRLVLQRPLLPRGS